MRDGWLEDNCWCDRICRRDRVFSGEMGRAMAEGSVNWPPRMADLFGDWAMMAMSDKDEYHVYATRGRYCLDLVCFSIALIASWKPNQPHSAHVAPALS